MVEQWKKYIRRIDQKKRDKLEIIIEKIIKGDTKKLNIKKLEGYEDIYRCKIGKLRIIFHNKDGYINIIKIGSRGDIYK